MSNKRKSKRLLKFFVSIVVLGMIMFLLPVSNIFAVDGDSKWDCPSTNLSKSPDGGNGAEYFVKYDAKPAGTLTFPGDFVDHNCDPALCANLEITEVVIKTGNHPGLPTGPITLVYYPDGTIRYFVGTSGSGFTEIPSSDWPPGVSGWYTVTFNSTTAPSSATVVQNRIALHDISHVEFYYKCVEVCEGKVTVVKTLNGRPPNDVNFSVDYYIGTPGGATRGPFTLNSDNNWSNTHTLPCGRNYSLWEDEDSLPEGFEFNKITSEGVTNPRIDGNNILFGIGPDNDEGTITIDNTEECKGEVTVKKFLNGGTPTEGFAVDFFVKVGDTTRGPFTLNSGNGWSMTFDTLPCDEVIEIWEDETSLPAGVVFDKIRSTIDGAVINGNSIIFTAASGDNGTIGIMNKEECTGKVTVVKYIDDKVATEGSFTIKISYGDVTREFTLDGSNRYSKTLNLPCGIEYKIWEDEGSLPGGIVFSKIRSTIQGAVIAGNSIIFTASSGNNGTIGIMNTEELYKIVVEKTTDGLVVANTDFNFNLVGPGTNVTKTIKAGAGSSGNITFENLKAGSYILTETNTGFNTWVSFSPDPKTSGSPGKSVTINLPQDADKKNTVYVYFHNDPTNGGDGNGKKDGDGDGIEVLGIQELPFTGFNWIYYVIGMALIIAGGFTSISVTRFLKRKEQ